MGEPSQNAIGKIERIQAQGNFTWDKVLYQAELHPEVRIFGFLRDLIG